MAQKLVFSRLTNLEIQADRLVRLLRILANSQFLESSKLPLPVKLGISPFPVGIAIQ